MASKQVSAILFPKQGRRLGFDVVSGVSMLPQRFAYAHLPHLPRDNQGETGLIQIVALYSSIPDVVNATPFDHDAGE